MAHYKRLALAEVSKALRQLEESDHRYATKSILRIYREQMLARPRQSAIAFSVILILLAAAFSPIAIAKGGVALLAPAILGAIGLIGLTNWWQLRSLNRDDARERREISRYASSALNAQIARGASVQLDSEEREALQWLEREAGEEGRRIRTALGHTTGAAHPG